MNKIAIIRGLRRLIAESRIGSSQKKCAGAHFKTFAALHTLLRIDFGIVVSLSINKLDARGRADYSASSAATAYPFFYDGVY
jgi:hypothetical protein